MPDPTCAVRASARIVGASPYERAVYALKKIALGHPCDIPAAIARVVLEEIGEGPKS